MIHDAFEKLKYDSRVDNELRITYYKNECMDDFEGGLERKKIKFKK
jgi:hypothetical protein